MWDEKKFFESYNKTMEQITPSQTFVNKMASLEKVQNKKPFKEKQIWGIHKGLATVCTIFILVIGIGLFQIKSNKDEHILEQAQISAEQNKVPIKQGSFGELMTNSLEQLQETLRDETISIKDEEGNELSKEERQELIQMLKDLKKVENSKEDYKVLKTYTIFAKEEVKIEILDNNLLRMANSNEIYEITTD